MRVFRQAYKDRKTGQTRHSSNWYVEFRDHERIARRWPVADDRKATHSIGLKLERLAAARRGDGTLDDDLARWVDNAPRDLRARLVNAGLIDARRLAVARPLAAHLDGEQGPGGELLAVGFRQALTAKGNTPAHVDQTVGRVRRVLDACGFAYWNELARPGALSRIQVHLASLRAASQIGTGVVASSEDVPGAARRPVRGRTVAYYVKALRQFGEWMAGPGGAGSNLLAGVEGVRESDADKVDRRPLSIDEVRWLISTAAGAGVRYGLDGAARALVYRFAYETGMRPGQIRGLACGAFALDASPPTVTARAATVKRRKPHTQVLSPAMAAELRAVVGAKVPAAAAFALPSKWRMADMLRDDLAAARAKWIEQAAGDDAEQLRRRRSDFLADVDHHEARVDFYSLRHTHGTALADARVPQKDIQASLHHTRSATTDRYVHSGMDARAAAIAALPDVGPARQQATGTDGRAADDDRSGPPAYRPAYRPMRAETGSGGLRQGGASGESPTGGAKNADFEGGGNECAGARTQDLRIKSPLLYQLSYALGRLRRAQRARPTGQRL